jgi:competence protein ComEA
MLEARQSTVDLNTANIEDLMTISGVIRERAQKIIEYRENNGPFKSWDDVRRIPGFSDDLVDLMRESGASLG